jgi:NAD(P)-dependent dehydrogenase (short-subunit alcohol dehydrogenase family)
MTELPNGGPDFSGRVAIVTGAGQHIGLELARRLARAGAAIVIFDKNAQSGGLAAKSITEAGGQAIDFAGDVSRTADFDGAVALAESSFGAVDILVNNAGQWVTKKLIDHSDEEFDSVLTTNIRGVFVGSRAVLPGMIQKGWGRIINLASIAAQNYTIPHASYAASKAAVMAMTRDLAYEVASAGVTVNAIAPGPVAGLRPGATQESSDAGLPMGKVTVSDIADAMMFLLSDGARRITGTTLPVAAGANIALSYGRLPEVRKELLGYS